MKLIKLFKNLKCVWDIFLIADDDGNCDILDFIYTKGDKVLKEWRTLQRKLEIVATSEEGVTLFGKSFSHEMGSSKKIFRFSQGSLRISWFYGGENKIIICAHAYVKSTQKTPTNEIKKADKHYEEYFRNNATR